MREKTLTLRLSEEGMAVFTELAWDLRCTRSRLVRTLLSEALADPALLKRVKTALAVGKDL